MDEYIFLGGDEVELSCFEKNPRVAAWLAQRGWTADMLPAHFWSRVRVQRMRPQTPAAEGTAATAAAHTALILPASLPRCALICAVPHSNPRSSPRSLRP